MWKTFLLFFFVFPPVSNAPQPAEPKSHFAHVREDIFGLKFWDAHFQAASESEKLSQRPPMDACGWIQKQVDPHRRPR